ncbi:MAG: endonuclease, partial [Bacteroidota bacterium]
NRPDLEIEHFSAYPDRFTDAPVLIAGDFNLDEQHAVWEPLKLRSYTPALVQTPTTLKRKCKQGSYFNYPIDNIFYPQAELILIESGRVDFVGACKSLEQARGISDHLPVYAQFEWRDPIPDN